MRKCALLWSIWTSGSADGYETITGSNGVAEDTGNYANGECPAIWLVQIRGRSNEFHELTERYLTSSCMFH